jgi:hypothetical protein
MEVTMRKWITIVAGIALANAGCGNATGNSSFADFGASADTTNSPGGGAKADDDASGTDLPPEKEKNYDFGAPEGSPNFVYIPAAGTDNLVKISGKTLQVTLVEVGDRPIVAKTVPGHDAVLVINAGSDDVAYVRSTATGDTVDFLPVSPHANALAVSPDGTSAIAYYDHDHPVPGEPAGSLQDVTLFRLGDKPEAVSIAVGFHPTSVVFRADGSEAFVVTDDGVCVIHPATAQDGIVAPIPLSTNPLDKPAEREVQITPDGTWAIVRQTGLKGLTVVHLPSKKLLNVTLDAVPTDLDLVPDGSAALAVVRDTAEVAIVALPKEATDSLAAEVLSTNGLVAGLAQITGDGKTALLYTTAPGIEQAATLDFATKTIAPVLLRKTVDFALLVPGTRKAILVHVPAQGPNYDDATEKFVDDSQGITLYDLDTGYTKLVLTPVRPTGIAALANPDLAWLLLPDPANLEHGVLRANLTQFQTEIIAVGSPPEYARVLEQAQMVAVTQTHPSGRVTFLPVAGGPAKTVTGYELSGKAH